MKWNNLPTYIRTGIIGVSIPLIIIPLFVFSDYLFPCIFQLSVSCDMDNKYSFDASITTISNLLGLGESWLYFTPYGGNLGLGLRWYSLLILQTFIVWFSLGVFYGLTQKLPWFLSKIFRVLMLLVLAILIFSAMSIAYLVVTS